MKTTSARSYATPYIENAGVTEQTPLDIIAALEANFVHPHTIHLESGPRPEVMQRILQKKVVGSIGEELGEFYARRELAEAKWKQKVAIHSNFGRYLPDDEKNLFNTCKEGLETTEEKLSAVVFAIDRLKGRRKWKREQIHQQLPELYRDRQVANKELVGNKAQWVGAFIHDLPPLTATIKVTKTNHKGKKKVRRVPRHLEDKAHALGYSVSAKEHEKAYYAIQLPDGTIVNLGKKDGRHNPVQHSFPSLAFQAIATRLGHTMRGGDTAILNFILGAEQVSLTNDKGEALKAYKWLPSYVSAWTGETWIVRIGWRLNPVANSGEFHRVSKDGETITPFVENAAGELERFNPDIHKREDILTASELDYKILCEDAGLEVRDENEEIVSYMNEDEELVMQGFMRDDDHADEEFDNYFITEIAGMTDRFIDFRNGSAIWHGKDFWDAFRFIQRRTAKEIRRLKVEIAAAKQSLDDIVQMTLLEGFDPKADEDAKALYLEHKRIHDKQVNRLRFVKQRYYDTRDDMMSQITMQRTQAAPRMAVVPNPTSKLPDSYKGAPAWTNISYPSHLTPPAKWESSNQSCHHEEPLNTIEEPSAGEVDMSKSNPFQCTLEQAKRIRRVKQVCASIIHGRFGMLVREKAAQLTFEQALEGALRAGGI